MINPLKEVFDKFYKRIKYLGQMIKILFKSDKPFLVTSLLQILIVSVTPFISMYLIKYSVDAFTSGVEFKEFVIIVCVYLVTWLALNLINNYLNNFNVIKGNLIGQRLYQNVLDKCLDIDYEKLLDKSILEKKELATKAFAGGALNALTINFRNIVSSIIILSSTFVIIINIDVLILCIAILAIIVNGVFSFWGKKHQYNIEEEFVPINRKIEYFVNLSTDFSVAKEVRLFHMKDDILKRFKGLYYETFGLFKKQYSINRKINNVSVIMNFILEISIYIYLGYKLIVKNLITIGDFTLYGNAIRQFKNSMSNLLGSFADIDKNGRHLKDYFEFIELTSEFKKSNINLPKSDDFVIRFENVSYKYPRQDKYALKNINITINKDMKLSLVGENGSGKTTFIKLLTRLCDPTEGNIYINDINIKDIDYITYQKLFSVVFQDFNMYAFKIKENVSMLQPVSDEQANQIYILLDKLGLKQRIKKTKKGLDTYLHYIYDEDGIELSGGESQKLAICRALYKQSPIVILDEPTAALDPRSEYEILTKFNELTDNRTAIYISHRLSSCRFSDKIAVFKNGNIIEYGNHDELIEKDGLYAELFGLQAHFYVAD